MVDNLIVFLKLPFLSVGREPGSCQPPFVRILPLYRTRPRATPRHATGAAQVSRDGCEPEAPAVGHLIAPMRANKTTGAAARMRTSSADTSVTSPAQSKRVRPCRSLSGVRAGPPVDVGAGTFGTDAPIVSAVSSTLLSLLPGTARFSSPSRVREGTAEAARRWKTSGLLDRGFRVVVARFRKVYRVNCSRPR
jgi:hypothetical protein